MVLNCDAGAIFIPPYARRISQRSGVYFFIFLLQALDSFFHMFREYPGNSFSYSISGSSQSADQKIWTLELKVYPQTCLCSSSLLVNIT